MNSPEVKFYTREDGRRVIRVVHHGRIWLYTTCKTCGANTVRSSDRSLFDNRTWADRCKRCADEHRHANQMRAQRKLRAERSVLVAGGSVPCDCTAARCEHKRPRKPGVTDYKMAQVERNREQDYYALEYEDYDD